MQAIDRGAKLVFDDAPTRDYNHATDSNYKSLRAQAEQLYQKRNKLAQQSQAAYKAGNKQKAHQLSEQSKQVLDEAEHYNRQAAEYVFRENNTDSAQDEIDLHGLYVKEAEYFLQLRIVQEVRTNQSHLNVIVGKGLHSKNGIAKLKPAIDDMCDESRLTHRIDPHNSGVLQIDLSKTSINQLPQRWVALTPSTGVYQPSGYQSYAPQYQNQNSHSQGYSQQQQQHNGNQKTNPLVDLFVNILCICINRSK
ncbi:hypothetical protein PSN45_002914 [Yamadazyma tenuis]|uniref:DUF1771-domain-containing protein n=1 Tax=Candida tenuis (strain ATCC 10573 / BCRC 21748 / CBS 615 / JCM 9827 / NBRC 10315 / NRRL Y-1498 / VKM Y-70) TaxID=590646 RepID=G3AW99_CANTC|nr:DUF1771-domain-containing protein [Yamadazyma tenuis ATCC 10573]XP_006684034.1 uncharacterized protein CANTEDRAFT_112208 [Yamadazyma tenuis ATCC 10573]EGV66775.1 DUF1771-domain-containing protein [Yamadazyma tenuis ATCC 10573]EGV66776.1 hypothetical protein CANTEDRAFT_112208 [Yamadazyma tenuis ATCC 10573]WEJ95395.1 hypothetical protein PSN45_002914 [Yamadazyma tenuis]